MKRFLTLIALLAPLSIAACGDDDKTTIIQPTQPQPSGTVVVPESNEPSTVVVPR